MVFTGLGSQFQEFPVKHQDFLKQRPTIFFLFRESLFLLSIFFEQGENVVCQEEILFRLSSSTVFLSWGRF